MKTWMLVPFILFLYGCSHPLEIEGQGDIVSQTGDRDCSLEEQPCVNNVVNEYIETFSAVPRERWYFERWDGCGDQFPACRLNISQEVVHQYWFQTVDALRAVFKVGMPEEVSITDVKVIGGDIYILDGDARALYRWSTQYQALLKPIALHAEDKTPVQFIHLPHTNSIYIAYDTNEITYIPLNDIATEIPLISFSEDLGELIPAGNFIVAVTENYSSRGNFNVIDGQGGIRASVLEYYPVNPIWNDVDNRLYFSRRGISPNDIEWVQVNQETGLIDATGDSPYHGDYPIVGPLTASPDGSQLMLGNGDTYDAQTLTWQGSRNVTFSHSVWSDEGLVVLTQGGNNQTILQRYDATDRLMEEEVYLGEPVAIAKFLDAYTVVTNNAGSLVFSLYAANDDRDGDGVINPDDSFPEDPAASVDTDRDGYPDVWNDGYTELDSVNSLALDSDAENPLCFLAGHLNSAQSCDTEARLPSYSPDRTVMAKDGVVYLLSAANSMVFRWSSVAESHLAPWLVGGSGASPQVFAYSEAHQRLYLGYESGEITYIDLLAPAGEQRFLSLSESIGGLAAVGKFLLAQDNSGARSTHYIIDKDGGITDSEEWNRYSRVYAWNESNNRVYFFRDQISPNDLHWEEIDQNSGQITREGDSPYHGDFAIVPPITVSGDGAYVILGSGDIYDSESLERVGGLDSTMAASAWSEGLATLHGRDGDTQLIRRDSSLNVSQTLTFSGEPLAIFAFGSNFIVGTELGGKPSFHIYEANDDVDGDGVNNTEDAFPLDPAASVDTDDDGHPDSWHAGKSQADSTTNLVVDHYPEDLLCYLPSHGDGDVCDVAENIPAYTPDTIVMDGEGILYLLHGESRRLYRWDSVKQEHLPPIGVGYESALGNYSPNKMAYAPQLNRLYLAGGGTITYVDLSDGFVEQPFEHDVPVVGQMIPVGDHLLIQGGGDFGAGWSSLHDEYGNTTIRRYIDVITNYVWDDEKKSLYLNGRKGLARVEIDITDGAMEVFGGNDYNWKYQDRALSLSADASGLLLGNGDVYSAETLKRIGSLALDDEHEFSSWRASWFALAGATQTGQTELSLLQTSTLHNVMSVTYDGLPLGLFSFGDFFYTVSLHGSKPIFSGFNLLSDTDGDLMPDWWELVYGLDINLDDSAGDLDVDGVTNLVEYNAFTDPSLSDSDGDGLSDYDEIMEYGTSPVLIDTDGDRYDDAWEVANSFTATIVNSVAGDVDGDGVLDFIEYREGSDPNDSLSVPGDTSRELTSFEGGQLPQGWSLEGAAWLTEIEARTGTYGLLLQNEGEVNVSAADTSGRLLSFYAKADCEDAYYQYLTYSVDGGVTSTSLQLSADWAALEIVVPLGAEGIQLIVSRNCSIYLDDFNVDGLAGVFTDSAKILTVYENSLTLLSDQFEALAQYPVPCIDGGLGYCSSSDVRDAVVTGRGEVVLFHGAFEPKLSVYIPELAFWQHIPVSGWSTVNNGTYGGIAVIGRDVYVTNMATAQSNSQGLIRYNLDSGLAEDFGDKGYIDVNAGPDGLLYALAGKTVDVYNPESLLSVDSFYVTDSRSIAVSEAGDVYTATWAGEVYRYSADASVLIDILDTDNYGLSDIDISSEGDVLISRVYDGLLITDEDLSEPLNPNVNASFSTFLPSRDN